LFFVEGLLIFFGRSERGGIHLDYGEEKRNLDCGVRKIAFFFFNIEQNKSDRRCLFPPMACRGST